MNDKYILITLSRHDAAWRIPSEWNEHRMFELEQNKTVH